MPQEFLEIIHPYITNRTYQRLLNFDHHNTTRLNHLYNVAVYSYAIGRKLNLFCDVDFESLLIGALLHDFHFVRKGEYKKHNCRNTHGMIASRNATKIFHITEKEQNIIESHMFPMVDVLPKSKEAWIVSFCDKFSAVMEACFCKNYHIPEELLVAC